LSLKAIGITDHGPSIPGAANELYFKNLYRAPKQIKEVRIFKGVEANFLRKGERLDLEKDIIKELDFLIVGFHLEGRYQNQDKVTNTRVLISIMEEYKPLIIGHPVMKDFPVDIKAVVDASINLGVLLEVNNCWLKLHREKLLDIEGYREMLDLCLTKKCPIIVNSDAHSVAEMGDFGIVDEFLGDKNPIVINSSFEGLLNWCKNKGHKLFKVYQEST